MSSVCRSDEYPSVCNVWIADRLRDRRSIVRFRLKSPRFFTKMDEYQGFDTTIHVFFLLVTMSLILRSVRQSEYLLYAREYDREHVEVV